jgi:hypothetical protein
MFLEEDIRHLTVQAQEIYKVIRDLHDMPIDFHRRRRRRFLSIYHCY